MIKKRYFSLVSMIYVIIIICSYYYCLPYDYEEVLHVLASSIFVTLVIATLALVCMTLIIMGLGKSLMKWTSGLVRFIPYVIVFFGVIYNIGSLIIMIGNMNFACVTGIMPTIVSYYIAKMLSYEFIQSSNVSTDIIDNKSNNKILKKIIKYIYMYLNIFIVSIIYLVWVMNIIIISIDERYTLFFTILCVGVLFISVLVLWGIYYAINKILDN